jgi:hypothetical protein
MKGIKIIVTASVLAVAIGGVSAYAATNGTEAANSMSSSSKVVLDKAGNVVDKDGKIVMTA